MINVLFVCTGNIFRSMVAEFAVKSCVDPLLIEATSAGIRVQPRELLPLVRRCLEERDIDPSGHMQRQITPCLFEAADLVVAMGADHQDWIERHYRVRPYLFNQICYGRDEPLLDLHEVFPSSCKKKIERDQYVIATINYIFNSVDNFFKNAPRFL